MWILLSWIYWLEVVVRGGTGQLDRKAAYDVCID